jgi:hypothetical protein
VRCLVKLVLECFGSFGSTKGTKRTEIVTEKDTKTILPEQPFIKYSLNIFPCPPPLRITTSSNPPSHYQQAAGWEKTHVLYLQTSCLLQSAHVKLQSPSYLTCCLVTDRWRGVLMWSRFEKIKCIRY